MILPQLQPIAPTWRKHPFDNPDWFLTSNMTASVPAAMSSRGAVGGQRQRGGTLGDAGLADRDLRAAQRQSGGLPDRRADQARQRLAQHKDRRTHALGRERRYSRC